MKKVLLFIFLFPFLKSFAQVPVSIGTDLSILRQLSEHQNFWAVGQTVQVNFHIKPKESAYALVSYYTNGKYKNNVTALAKNNATTPSQINYTANTILRYRQVSLGWKHFFKGAYDNEEGINIFGTAGFGLLFGRAETITSVIIDTAKYYAKPISGTSGFKRLTFDVSLGVEKHIGGNIYFYSEAKSWLPASQYPSPLLYNDKVPFTIALNGGIRILIL